jgi:hypothetical protein
LGLSVDSETVVSCSVWACLAGIVMIIDLLIASEAKM